MTPLHPADIVASLRHGNIAEALLYLWQQEDLVRAYALDIDRMDSELLAHYPVPDDERASIRQWYADLMEMLRSEGAVERGHAQVHNNILIDLNDLHTALLRSTQYPFYSAAYYKALPFIVELRSRSHTRERGELENCFEALYGLMLLRLQGKSVSTDTQQAMAAISKLIALLAAYYKDAKEGKLELDT